MTVASRTVRSVPDSIVTDPTVDDCTVDDSAVAPGTLAPMDVPGRLERLRTAMATGAGPAALLVTNLTNIRYLTGFVGTAGMLFVLPTQVVLLTDGRYATQAEQQLQAAEVDACVEVSPAAQQGACASALVTAARLGELGVEADHVSWSQQRRFAESWFVGVDVVATIGVVEGLRRVKDSGEVARLRQAAAIADAALAAVRDLLDESPTERDVAFALEAEMRRLGASGPAFETIVAAGPEAAQPHHRPGSRRIRSGEAVVIDFGARVDGYCSDMTRTFWVGELAPEMRRAVDVVGASQAAGVAAVTAGVAAAAVDAVCREVIASAGWADRFVHGTGHGVGLDIHEAPAVASTSTDTLQVGHVVTIEPGVYLPGIGGVRIEDTVVVTDEGCEPLTLTPKDL